MMGKRDSARSGPENDVASRYWRRQLTFLGRPGVTSKIKRDMRRRERQQARKSIRRGED